MKERDVFKASHDKQAQRFEQTAEAPSNPSESAQVTGLLSILTRVSPPDILPCLPARPYHFRVPAESCLSSMRRYDPPGAQSVHGLCHLQDKYAASNQSAQNYTNGSSVPAAKGERLADVSPAKSASGLYCQAVPCLC